MRLGRSRMGTERAAIRAGAAGLVFVLAGFAGVRAAPADVFHLRSGGAIEGEITDTREGFYHIRTVVGTVTLPLEAVTRVETRPSPFAEYEARRQRAADTPAAQTELGQWCAEEGLLADSRRHFARALELDADYEPARRALGYVRVGEFWIDGRTTAPRTEPLEPPEDPADAARREEERLSAAIQADWMRKISAIKTSMLDAGTPRSLENGRAMILEIRDPLAILPLVRVLGRANPVCRDVLVEALGGFPQDEATLNLAVMVLIDPDRRIRADALHQLTPRQDPRVAAQFRKALASDNDVVIARAAIALGELKVREAVPELIRVLKARRRKMVEMPVRRYFTDMRLAFGTATSSHISSSHRVVHQPQIGFWTSGLGPLETEFRMQNVTVYRTEVLEALRAITGRNFGFDEDEWIRWYQEQKS